jgi:two-component system nitrogen regulation response regulator NtrX
VYAALEARSFPGNVRELKNVIERAAILASDNVTIADLPEDPHASPWGDDGDGEPVQATKEGTSTSSQGPDGTRLTLREHRDRAERGYIVEVLGALEWNISRAAIALGVERTNLHKKIRMYGIKRGELS